jgi:hypothetical protein
VQGFFESSKLGKLQKELKSSRDVEGRRKTKYFEVGRKA